MLKHCVTTFTWTALVALTFCTLTIGFTEADPTDDFSFSLGHATKRSAYDLMSEKEVATILRDHLDLFPKAKAPRLAHHLLKLCEMYRFDPAFILSLIQVESRFRVKVRSPMGAVGLMQVMPATADLVIRNRKLFLGDFYLQSRAHLSKHSTRFLTDPFVNVSVGLAYLAHLRDRYREFTPYYLVAAYNLGPTRLDELLSRKSFKPVSTKKYYEDIRRGVPGFRFYSSIRKKPAHI